MLNNQRTACRVAESTSGMISFAPLKAFQISEPPSDNPTAESQWLRECWIDFHPVLHTADRDRIPIRDGLQIQKFNRL
jgi:hypothetical protein